VESAERVTRGRRDVLGTCSRDARRTGARIGQRAIRAAKDRLIAGVIPHLPASTRVPVAGRVRPACWRIFAAVFRELDGLDLAVGVLDVGESWTHSSTALEVGEQPAAVGPDYGASLANGSTLWT
jgi:hypothetical protein